MDPNAALEVARTSASKIIAAIDTDQIPDPSEVEVLAQSFRDLDDWLSGGGFLPEAWKYRNASF